MEVLGIQNHILYLKEVLLIAAVCYPTSLNFAIENALFSRASRDKANIENIASMAISTLLIVLVASILAPEYVLFLNYPAFWFYPISVLLGPLCIVFEYLLNGSYLYFKKGFFPNRFEVHSFWTESNKSAHFVLMFFIVAGEEIIFRQTMFSLLISFFHFSFLQTLIFTSFIYAANHSFMGFNSVRAKFLTGMIYGSLYYITGLSLVVPLITHYVQNITLLRFNKVTIKHANIGL